MDQWHKVHGTINTKSSGWDLLILLAIFIVVLLT